MILSDHLTPEMAVNYLYQWRTDSKYIAPLLDRLHSLCLKSSVHYIPTIMYLLLHSAISWAYKTTNFSKTFAKKLRRNRYLTICLSAGRIQRTWIQTKSGLRTSFPSWILLFCSIETKRSVLKWSIKELSKNCSCRIIPSMWMFSLRNYSLFRKGWKGIKR
jgi:hypothetical protein